MPAETSYSIYVHFRGRRLALLKHIRGLAAARAALSTLRAQRFHDPDQVFLVNDATKEIVVEASQQGCASPPADCGRDAATLAPAAVTAVMHVGQQHACGPEDHVSRDQKRRSPITSETEEQPPLPPRTEDASSGDREEACCAPRGAHESSPSNGGVRPHAVGLEEGLPPACVDLLNTPIGRLRRAMSAARSAQARHAAAVDALRRARRDGVADTDELRRIEDSARDMAHLSGRVLEQLERVISTLSRSRP